MSARRSLSVLIACICISSLFLIGRDSPDAAADPNSGTPGKRPGQIVPVINLLLLAEDARCVADADCDDGLWCNGAEVCVEGQCRPGTPPNCDDGIDCTLDSCNEALQRCDHTPQHGLCDDGNPCTDNLCDPVAGCVHACNATGTQDDPCCDDDACQDSPLCPFSGGLFQASVTRITQKPDFCLVGLWRHLALEQVLGSFPVPLLLPPENAYPTLILLPIPFVGNLQVTAHFEDGELRFEEVDLEPIRLQDFAALVPPSLQGLINFDELHCLIDAKGIGWTTGLDNSGFVLTVRLYDMVVTPEGEGLTCLLHTPVPHCRMEFTLPATR